MFSWAFIHYTSSINHRLESAGLDAFEELCFESVTENWRYSRFPPSQVS